MQSVFNLSEIDREATRKAMDVAFEQYQYFLLMNPLDVEPNITSSFKLVSVAPSNQFYSSTEDIAIERIEMERKSSKYIEWIQQAVNRLSYQERLVIINRYLKAEDVYDYEVYNELGFSEAKYYRIKSKALQKLAFILGIEKYKKVKQN